MRSTFPFVMLASVTRAYRLGPSVLRAPVTTSLRRASTQTVSMGAERDDIRNIAIVAHVDHGKTSLVDSMLVAAESLNQNIGKDDRLMDSNDQERERGITILAKNAALQYGDVKVNIVDTPGHADFGGEVERVLNMVDGVLLLVDAAEGPKPQTRFVLKKALGLGLRVLVVVNKIDKPAARPDFVVDKTFDLFCELGASDEQTDFPIVYTSAINRMAAATFEEGMASLEKGEEGMSALFDEIIQLPKPQCDAEGPLQLQISNIGSDPFIGRLGIGRIKQGVVKKNAPVGISKGPGEAPKQVKVSELFAFDALGRKSIEEAEAGEIVVFSGLSEFDIGDTLVDMADPQVWTAAAQLGAIRRNSAHFGAQSLSLSHPSRSPSIRLRWRSRRCR